MKIPITSIIVNGRLRTVDKAKVAELADSMKEIGLLQPVIVNASNKLIAGLHRLEAAKFLGWKEIESSVVKLEGLDVQLAEIDENLMRNDLHYADRAAMLKQRKDIYEQKYPQTKPHISQGEGKKASLLVTKSDSSSKKPTEPFVKSTSKSVGIPQTTIREELQIAKNVAPEALLVLKEKDVPKRDAVSLSREKPEVQKQIIEKIKKQPEAKVSFARAKKEVEHEQHKEELAKASPPMPDGLYDVIYIDPPWSLEDKGSRAAPSNNADFKYDTHSLEDIIKNQPPIDVNAVMFLWVPATMIREALQLIDAWGFTYKTHAVWDKGQIGIGHYFRTQHEDLFFAMKGSMGTSETKSQSSILKYPRREHSRKPDEMYEIIENMYPNRRYLECYAREAPTRKGWTMYGKEATSRVQ